MPPTTRFTPADTQQQAWRRLRRMRMIPLALLLLMALCYALTLHAPQHWQDWRAWVHAFAEAAMVGAMADWFAVTALFRHPLGLPIPHTAIVPRRKDEIGASLAQFVADHFFTRAALEPRLGAWNPVQRLLHWLSQESAQQQLSHYTLRLTAWLFQAVDEAVPRRFLTRLWEEQLDSEQLSRSLGHALGLLIDDGRHQELLTLGLRLGARQLRRHRLDIRLHVRAGSPWWMPGFVDEPIVGQMLDRVEELLLAMADDPQHELRAHYHRQVQLWLTRLQSGDGADWLRRWQQGLSQHPVVRSYFSSLWQELGDRLLQACDEQDSQWHRQTQQFFASFQQQLADDRAMQDILAVWVNQAIASLISSNRHEIAGLIRDTIAGWDAHSTAQLIELHIGADLQYIRINGTLVGGVIGLLLFALSQSLLH